MGTVCTGALLEALPYSKILRLRPLLVNLSVFFFIISELAISFTCFTIFHQLQTSPKNV